jgi:hypothetical protein
MSAPKKPRVEDIDVSKLCISAFYQKCAECDRTFGPREWAIIFLPTKQRGTKFSDKLVIVPVTDVKAISPEAAPKGAKWSKVSMKNGNCNGMVLNIPIGKNVVTCTFYRTTSGLLARGKLVRRGRSRLAVRAQDVTSQQKGDS